MMNRSYSSPGASRGFDRELGRASLITTLYSTDVNSAHELFPPYAFDPHYVMSAGSSDGTTRTLVELPAGGRIVD